MSLKKIEFSINFDTNQDLVDFIPTVEKAGFKPHQAQVENGILKNERFISLYNTKEYLSYDWCRAEEITPEQFKERYSLEDWPKIYRGKSDDRFCYIWPIEGSDYMIKSLLVNDIESLKGEIPITSISKNNLRNYYEEYTPIETIEIDGKKYNADEVR